MRWLRLPLVLLMALAGLPAEGRGQGVALAGGDVDLVVPVMGTEFGVAVDQSTTIVWRGSWRPLPHKITVESDGAGQKYFLTLEALVQAWFARGTGPVDITVGAPPQDLIVDVYTGLQRAAPLRYEATAAPLSSPGMDVHTITFTITQQ